MTKRRFCDVNDSMYKKHIASLFANSIATIEPKISIDNDKLTDEFNKFKKVNNLIDVNYQLVYLLSLNGQGCLFLTDAFNKEYAQVFASKIIYLNYNSSFQLSEFKIEFTYHDSQVLVEWNKKNMSEYTNFKYTTNYFCEYFTTLYTQLPIWFFKNNPLSKTDMDNVEKKWISDYNESLDILLSDSKTSKSLFHLNTPMSQASRNNINNLKACLEDPSSVVFENHNIFSLLQSGGLQIQQGNSIYLSIIEKLKFYDNKIKELTFVPRSTLDSGTKNMHSDEINSINSQSDDYLELKANLLETGWENFIRNIYFDYLKNNKDEFKNFDFSEVQVDVEIAGSTKFLKNRANEYIQNQNGSLINPNDLNDNNTHDLQQEQTNNDEAIKRKGVDK